MADSVNTAQVQLYGQQDSGLHPSIGHRSRIVRNNQLFPPIAIRWNRFSALTKAALFEKGSLDASEFNKASSIASGGDEVLSDIAASVPTMISGAAVALYTAAADELLCRCFGTSDNKLSGQIS